MELTHLFEGGLPEGWTVRPLGELSSFISKGATPTTYGYKWQSDGVAFLRSECVAAHGLDLAQAEFISEEAHAALNRGEVKSGDLLMTITGNVGRTVLLPEDFGVANINQHIARVRITDPEVSSSYVSHHLSQPEVREHYETITTGQAYPQISLRQVRETAIPLPPLPEQRAIAAALTEVDDLVAALDALIAKKRAVKTAAMQRLLTGRQRLAGFAGEWENGSLGDVIDHVAGGGTPSRSNSAYWGGQIPWATVKDISSFDPSGTQETITEEGLKNSATRLVPAGTLILATRMLLGRAVVYETDVSINQDLKALYFSPDTSVEFMNHWLDWKADHIDSLGSGSTVRGLALKDLRALEFGRPGPAEQEAIAEVLTDMDAEIAALEARRDKIAMVKTGMMQELLTGRTRLV